MVSSDLGVTEFKQHHAIGSGSEYALGAMHALVHVEPDDSQVVRGACQAAIAMDVSCGGAVEILWVECPDS
jgi:ATP-dependent protease HslVU (ClpYQ) peptidase subunit